MIQILQGNCLDRLRELPDESVQCVVTSPPYWGLRDYGIPPVEWPAVTWSPMSGLDSLTTPAESSVHGLEPTLQSFVAHEVLIFREVRRVLKSDGVCFVNLGDGYAHGKPGGGCVFENGRTDGRASYDADKAQGRVELSTMGAGLPPKNLLGIPWRVAYALQADGWFLRQDIIWHKPNPMPESITDRCTKAHEYIFLLTKSEKYFWNKEAIAEPASTNSHQRVPKTHVPSGWETGESRHDPKVLHQNGVHRKTRKPGVPLKSEEPGRGTKSNSSFHAAVVNLVAQRNPRSVWSIQSEAFPEAHFATFPSALPRRCILAGSRHGDTVLDLFAGSGTTGMVATELGRKSILIEANPEYVELIRQRTNVTPGLL